MSKAQTKADGTVTPVPGTLEAFNKYLAQGAPAYFDKERLTPKQALEMIRQSGGLPVLSRYSAAGYADGSYRVNISHRYIDLANRRAVASGTGEASGP